MFLKSKLSVFALSAGLLLSASANVARAGRDMSPAEAFRGVVEGFKKDDMKAAMGHMTVESQQILTGMLVFGSVWAKDAKSGADIDAVLSKHGVPEVKIREVLKKAEEKRSGDFRDVFGPLAGLVKDPPAFVQDMLRIARKHAKGDINLLEGLRDGKLVDVVLDDSGRATAKVVSPDGGNAIAFEGDCRGWRVDLVPFLMGSKK